MLHGKQWLAAAVLITAGLGLTGCAQGSEASAGDKAKAAKVTTVEGSKVKQVTLTQEAADRLVIETTAVKEASVPPRVAGQPAATRMVVPYSALLYDVDGTAWVFASTAPLTYVRQRINVDYVTGNVVVLSGGPPLGTAVVTKGGAELFGTELGVAK
jgi:hypothetical protein